MDERGDAGRLPLDPDLDRRPGRSRRGSSGQYAAIALGGALGAPARYGVAQAIHARANAFPAATFWTNASGSLLLGLLLALILERFPPTRYLRPFAATGFCGAYTTYSTFAVEGDLLAKNGHVPIAVVYVAGTYAAGFAAVWTGIWAVRALPQLRRQGGTR